MTYIENEENMLFLAQILYGLLMAMTSYKNTGLVSTGELMVTLDMFLGVIRESQIVQASVFYGAIWIVSLCSSSSLNLYDLTAGARLF